MAIKEKRTKDSDVEMFYIITESEMKHSFTIKNKRLHIRENGDLEVKEDLNQGKEFETQHLRTCFYSPAGKWVSYSIYWHSTIFPDQYEV